MVDVHGLAASDDGHVIEEDEFPAYRGLPEIEAFVLAGAYFERDIRTGYYSGYLTSDDTATYRLYVGTDGSFNVFRVQNEDRG